MPSPSLTGFAKAAPTEAGLSLSTLGEHAFDQVPDAHGTSRIGRPSGSVVAEMPDQAALRASGAPVRVPGLDEESSLPPELLPANLPPRRGVGAGDDTNFPVLSDQSEIPRDPAALRRAQAEATRGLKHKLATPPDQPNLDDLSNIEDEDGDIPDEVSSFNTDRAAEAAESNAPGAQSNDVTTTEATRKDEHAAAAPAANDAVDRNAQDPADSKAQTPPSRRNATDGPPDDGGMFPDHGGMFPDDGGMFPNDGGMFPQTAAQIAGLDKLATTEDSFPIPLAAFDQPVFRPRSTASVEAARATAPMVPQTGTPREEESDAALLADAEAFLHEALAGGVDRLPEPTGGVAALDDDAAEFVQGAFDAERNGVDVPSQSSLNGVRDLRETLPVLDNDELQSMLRRAADDSLPGAGGAFDPDSEPGLHPGFGARPSPSDDDSDPFGVPAPHEAAIPGVRGPSGEHSALHNIAKIEGTVDPLVEFGEMFREARAEEAEDPAAVAALADIMLGNQFGGERAGKAANDLKLMGGSPRSGASGPFRRERVSMPSAGQVRVRGETPASSGVRHSDTTDEMLSGAMSAAERDATPPVVVAAQAPPRVVRRQAPTEELDGVGDNRKTTYFLSTLLVTVLTLVGVAGYIAYKNDGFLDLKEPDQMLGVAFRDQTYLPRFRTVLRASEDGVETEVPATDGDLARGDQPLAVQDITTGYYTNEAGTEFVLLHGTVANQADVGYRRVVVLAELVDSTGAVVRSRLVPAGQRIDQPGLEASVTPADLNALYGTIAESAADLIIAPTNLTPFTAVFVVGEGQSVEGLTYRAEVQRGERQAASPWRSVSFGTVPEVTD